MNSLTQLFTKHCHVRTKNQLSSLLYFPRKMQRTGSKDIKKENNMIMNRGRIAKMNILFVIFLIEYFERQYLFTSVICAALLWCGILW